MVLRPLLKGMEGVFIPVKNLSDSVKWYEEKLGCTTLQVEEEAVTMKIAEESKTVICLVRTPNHKPMEFPENNFGVAKYYNFIPSDIEEVHKALLDQGVKVNSIGGEGNMKFFTFYDLDGNPLGCCKPGKNNDKR